MKQSASSNDFNRLSDAQRERHVELLKQLHYLRLTCRVEVSGRDLIVTVAPSLPPAAYWLDRYDIEFDRDARMSTTTL